MKQFYNVGENVTILCFEGLAMKWTFNDEKLPRNVKQTMPNVIHIVNIQPNNRGHYYCSGINAKLNRKFISRSTVGVIGIWLYLILGIFLYS